MQHSFLSPYEGILKLENNIPSLTHFEQTNNTRRTNELQGHNFLRTLRQHLNTERLQILQADKGPGLVLIHNNTLTYIYKEYHRTNAVHVTAATYNETLRKLILVLYLMSVEITSDAVTDDRPPTMYLKIKTHKPTFSTQSTSKQEIYVFTNGPNKLTSISRPIIIHTSSTL